MSTERLTNDLPSARRSPLAAAPHDGNTAFPAVDAQGSRHRKLPSGPLRQPASHRSSVHDCSPLFATVRYCSPLFTKKILLLLQCRCTLRRSRSAPRQAPFAVRIPSLSALLPLRRTQYEPMSRKGNVLFCVDATSSTRRARRLAEVRGSQPGPSRYSANGERANLLHSGGGRKVTRPVSIMGAVPMESAEDHRTRACVHKICQEAEAKRVVRPDGSGIRFPRSTSS